MDNAPANKYRLVAIPSNAEQISRYETALSTYMTNKVDRWLLDTLPEAWKEDNVGGLRASMLQRIRYQNLLHKNNFEQFREARIQELRQIITYIAKLPNYSREQLREMAKPYGEEFALLTKKKDNNPSQYEIQNYQDFALVTRKMDQYRYRFYVHPQDDNKQQVEWTRELIPQIINNRYEMMQSIAFRVANNENLDSVPLEAENYVKKVLEGMGCYLEHKDDNVYWFTIAETTDVNERDKESFKFIKTPAFEMQGLAETLGDAITAIFNSPEWPIICQYYYNKEDELSRTQSVHRSRASHWDDGSKQSIEVLSNAQEINIKSLAQSGVEYETYIDYVLPNLRELHKNEQMYNFLVKHINEFNEYKRTHPEEIEKLTQQVKDKNNREKTYVQFYSPVLYQELLNKNVDSLNSICSRLMTNHEMVVAVHEIIKQSINTGVFCVNPWVGAGLFATDIFTHSLQHDALRVVSTDWEWKFETLTEWKNGPVFQDMEKKIEELNKLTSENKHEVLNENFEDFKAAVEWAAEHATDDTQVTALKILPVLQMNIIHDKVARQKYKDGISETENKHKHIRKALQDYCLNKIELTKKIAKELSEEEKSIDVINLDVNKINKLTPQVKNELLNLDNKYKAFQNRKNIPVKIQNIINQLPDDMKNNFTNSSEDVNELIKKVYALKKEIITYNEYENLPTDIKELKTQYDALVTEEATYMQQHKNEISELKAAVQSQRIYDAVTSGHFFALASDETGIEDNPVISKIRTHYSEYNKVEREILGRFEQALINHTESEFEVAMRTNFINQWNVARQSQIINKNNQEEKKQEENRQPELINTLENSAERTKIDDTDQQTAPSPTHNYSIYDNMF